MNKTKAIISILMAGTLWGCISIFINGMRNAGLTIMGISAVRMVFGAVLFILFLLITDRSKLKIEIRDIWMFLLSGIVSFSLFNYLYTYTVLQSQASIAVVLLYTSPIFTIILSAIFFKEKLTVKKIAALIVVSLGCVMVSGLLGGSYKISLLVLLTGLGSGLFWGSYTIFSRITLRKYSSITASAWTVIIAGIAMLPFGIAENVTAQIAQKPVIILWGLGIAIVSTVLPYALYTYGLQYVESGQASIMVTIELVVGSLVGMLIFGEPAGAVKIIGIVLCVLAIVILNINIPLKNNVIKKHSS